MSETPTPPFADAARPVAAIAAKSLLWLWYPWLGPGLLTLLDGNPEVGKSLLTVELAARVSRGLELNQGGNADRERSAAALILSAEDDPARVIRPRLEAAGADLERVFVLDCLPGQPTRQIQLPDDIETLREIIQRHQVALVVIDPLVAFLGRGISAGSDQQVRRALHQLRQLAEETQCAIVIVRHLTKAGNLPAIFRGGGSIGILGACRIALLVGKDPADDTRRVLAMNKCNLTAKPASLRFHLEKRDETAVVVWDGDCDWTADEIVGKVSEEEVEAVSRVDECAEFIVGRFKFSKQMLANELTTWCKAHGFGTITVKRARKKLGIKAIKLACGVWEVKLPAANDADAGARGSREAYRKT